MAYFAIPEFPEPMAWPLSLVSWPLTLLSNSLAKLNTLWAETPAPAGECQEPDFSQLPELAWTMITSNLEQRDKLALAVTCHRLYSVCKTESILWRSAALHLGNRGTRYWWMLPYAELNSTERSVLQSHSHQIEKMEIVINICQIFYIEWKSSRILYESVPKWPLKELSIDWIFLEFFPEPCNPSRETVSLLIKACLSSKNTKGLKKLTVRNCLLEYEDKVSFMFEALKASPFTDSLRELTLEPSKIHYTLIRLSHTIPQVVECVGRFQNLQSLWLYSGHVSDLLLETLSDSMTTQFKQLGFSGCFIDFQETITKWSQLISCRPDLKVCLGVVCCVNRQAALAAFPSIVPIKCITVNGMFTAHQGVTGTEVLNLLPAYSKTLTTFAWLFKSRSSFDSILIDTIRRCRKLDCLSFHGRISSSSVSTLASTRHWQRLEFLERSITFPESNTETQAEQMSKLKTAVHSHLGDRCVFVRDSDDPIQRDRFIQFKIKREPVTR